MRPFRIIATAVIVVILTSAPSVSFAQLGKPSELQVVIDHSVLSQPVPMSKVPPPGLLPPPPLRISPPIDPKNNLVDKNKSNSHWNVSQTLQPKSFDIINNYGVALVIGNKNYTGDQIPDVKYAHNDADAFVRWLTDVLGYQKKNIINLRDATQAQMEAALGNNRTHEGTLWQYLRPGKKSDVTVFYSGHGVPGLKDGRGYLLPVNADPNKPEINGYPLEVLHANLAKIRAEANSVTVYLDACFSGGSGGGGLIKNISSLAVEFKQVNPPVSLTVLTAAEADQVASWDDESKHGLFTKHLLVALYGKADVKEFGNGDGIVQAGEVKKYLDEEMTYAARRKYGRRQVASLKGGSQIRLGPAAKTAVPQTASLQLNPSDGLPGSGSGMLACVQVRPNELVRQVQLGLRKFGLGIAADNRFGPATKAGIERFEATFGRAVTGAVSRDLLCAIQVKAREGRTASLAALAPPPAKPQVRPAVGTYFTPGKTFRDCAECPEMVIVPAGSFMMGSPSSEPGRFDSEGPQHRVTIGQAFAVGKYEVTQGEWRSVMGNNPSRFKGDRNPVETVSWGDARVFVKKLSEKTGKRHRLLSEAEWEYVARAGTTTRYHCGDSNGCLDNAAWHSGNAGDRTKPIGQKSANSFGLHDMHGNVWEWIEDCWNDSYQGAPTNGGAWTSGSCSRRVLRGGSWGNNPRNLHSANRIGISTSKRVNSVGFRVARTL